MAGIENTSSNAKAKDNDASEIDCKNQKVEDVEATELYSPCISRGPKERFNDCCEVIANNVAVNYDNKEIQDIQEAMLEMLTWIENGVNKRDMFKVSRILPAGSMADRTSLLLKTHNDIYEGVFGEAWYVEFDFLALLELPTSMEIERQTDCTSCMKVPSSLVSVDTARKHSKYRYGVCNYLERFEYISAELTNSIFQVELNNIRPNCECCTKDQTSRSFQLETGCVICSVRKSTGTLRIIHSSYIPYDKCSVSFIWSSKKLSLQIIDDDTLGLGGPIRQMIIPVDFLPAIEISKPDVNNEHECILVAKKCNTCDACSVGFPGWRKSCCTAEIETLKNRMSSKHRKCYLLLKLMWKWATPNIFEVKSYHVKTVVLHHICTCSDTSEDCHSCVIAILEELLKAYRTRKLVPFGQTENMLSGYEVVWYARLVSRLLAAILHFESWQQIRKVILNM